METIFRKVSPEERLPTQTGRYHTNRGLTNYFHEALEYPPKGFEYRIDYWLEEIALPSPEQIEPIITDILDFADSHSDVSEKISKWIKDFVKK